MAEKNTDLTNNLNWFGFETRIRKIISIAISPLAEQIRELEDWQKLNQLRFDNLNNDIKDLNGKIHRTIKRTNELNEIRNNLYDLSQTVRAHEVTNYEKHGASNVDIKSLKDKVKQIGEDFQNMDAINNNLKAEIGKYVNFTLEHKLFYNDKLNEMNTEFIKKNVTELKSKISKLQLNDSFKEGIIDQQRIDIAKLIFDFEHFKMSFESSMISIKDFTKFSKIFHKINCDESVDKEVDEGNISDFYFKDSYTNHHMKILSNRIDQIEKDLRMTDNYIEKQIPVIHFKEIWEVIDFWISSKEVRGKVKEFVDYKLTELNEIIENDKGWPTFSKQIVKADVTHFKFENSPLIDYLSNSIGNIFIVLFIFWKTVLRIKMCS